MSETEKRYYIISLKWSTGDNMCFWRSNNAGYTEYLDEAGIYNEADIKEKPNYYNSGKDTIAIEVDRIEKLFVTHTIAKRNTESLNLIKSELNKLTQL